MAAGPITLIIKDSQGYPRRALFWSSDGTSGGDLTPIHKLDADQLAALTDALAPLGTEATLQALLAKMIAAPATAAKQDTIIAGLGSIDGHVDGLESVAASILAKLSSDPATQTTLEAVRALLAGSLSAIAPPPTSATVTIASGQSVSAAAQVDGKLAGIILPSGWTAAAVTFLGSVDGETFVPIYDAGVERAIASGDAVAGRMISLSLSDWLGVKHVQIRSGTAASAVSQTAARTITLLKVA